MRNSIKLTCIFLLLMAIISCKKEISLEAKSAKITGDMTYKQTGSRVLGATITGQPTVIEVSMNGEGTLNVIGKVSMKTSFVFDLIKGEGKNFITTYTDEKGNTIKMSGAGKVVPDKEWDLYINEKAISGTGRYAKITQASGGISGTSIKQDSISTGRGRIEWTLSF